MNWLSHSPWRPEFEPHKGRFGVQSYEQPMNSLLTTNTPLSFANVYNIGLTFLFFFSLLNFQKQHRVHRDTLIDDVAKDFHTHVKNHGLQPVNFRDIYSSDIFGLALKEVSFICIF